MSTWTTPITFTANATLTKAIMDTEVRDHLNWLKGAFDQLNVVSDTAKPKITPALVGVRATRGSNQTTGTGVSEAIGFTGEEFDSDGFHSIVTNVERLTVPSGMGAYYLIGGHASFAANATGFRQLTIRLGGATTIDGSNPQATSASVSTIVEVTTLYQLDAAEYIELIAFQNSGGNLDVQTFSDYSPIFWMHRLSST